MSYEDGRPERLKAHAANLRAIAETLDAEAAFLELREPRPFTESVLRGAQTMTLRSAMADVPWCDGCNRPLSSCLGCHEGTP